MKVVEYIGDKETAYLDYLALVKEEIFQNEEWHIERRGSEVYLVRDLKPEVKRNKGEG